MPEAIKESEMSNMSYKPDESGFPGESGSAGFYSGEQETKDVELKVVVLKILRDLLIIVLSGFAYYLVVKYTDMEARCYIHELFGLNCPACGLTRMMISLIRLDLKDAYNYNRFMFISFPAIVGEVVYLFYIIEAKKENSRINQKIVSVWVVCFIIWGIAINTMSVGKSASLYLSCTHYTFTYNCTAFAFSG